MARIDVAAAGGKNRVAFLDMIASSEIGAALLGSATSMVAGIALLQIPNLDPLALLGIGSALGIVGSQYIEILLRRKARAVMGRE
ncbi:MAG: hypothetical protein QJR04_09635 [Burkholderia multivorans]|nr:hypothetical protein [Burkholderia multivorans]